MTTTVLYIDDEPMNLTLVRKLLGRFGYTLLEAIDAKNGLQMALRNRPDVILMDMNMPEIGGLEATKIFKEHPDLHFVPIIGLTADTSEELRRQATAAGCEAHLHKPISRSLLLKTIQQVLDNNLSLAI